MESKYRAGGRSTTLLNDAYVVLQAIRAPVRDEPATRNEKGHAGGNPLLPESSQCDMGKGKSSPERYGLGKYDRRKAI